MYTGSYTPAPRKRRRRFGVLLCVMLCLVLCGLVAVGVLAVAGGFGFVRLPDGEVRFGNSERLLEDWRQLPDVSIYDTPKASFPVMLDSESREILSANAIYKKSGESVTGILSSSDYGEGSGTGVIMSSDGYIITNYHVIDGATLIEVVLHDGETVNARVIGKDRLTDLAVLKIEKTGLVAAEFGNSDRLEHGDPVVAIGNPLGLDLQNTVTDGIISGINRDITLNDSSGEVTMTVLQTNCAVNPGNSGGPLFNSYGQVIGIISAKIMSDASQAVEGLGFAIPINTAIPIIEELLTYGYVKGRPTLGILVNTSMVIDQQTAQFYGVQSGIIVMEVHPDSDAYAKGLQPQDIITHVDGEPVSDLSSVNKIKNTKKAGDTLKLTVFRRGEVLNIEIMLMEEGSIVWDK